MRNERIENERPSFIDQLFLPLTDLDDVNAEGKYVPVATEVFGVFQTGLGFSILSAAVVGYLHDFYKGEETDLLMHNSHMIALKSRSFAPMGSYVLIDGLHKIFYLPVEGAKAAGNLFSRCAKVISEEKKDN